MCLDPISMAVLAGVQGIMQYQQVSAQAKAQQDMYNAQAEADEQNAKIQQRKNESVADAYAQEQQKINSRAKLARGEAAAEFGASGLDFSAGSGLDILSGIDDAHNQDSTNLLTNQRNDQYEGAVVKGNFINSANSNRAASKNIGEQAKYAKIATLLGTATNAAASYYKYNGFGNSGSSPSATKSNGLWDTYQQKNPYTSYKFDNSFKR